MDLGTFSNLDLFHISFYIYTYCKGDKMNTLYVMCGPSGSGKSTYAKENLKRCIVISTDSIREELWGSEENQRAPQKVFELAYARMELYLRAGYDVVFDAMNLRARHRRRVLEIGTQCGVKKTAIVMATPLHECLVAQDYRDRCVPDDIVRAQYEKFEYPMLREGWDEIRVIERI